MDGWKEGRQRRRLERASAYFDPSRAYFTHHQLRHVRGEFAEGGHRLVVRLRLVLARDGTFEPKFLVLDLNRLAHQIDLVSAVKTMRFVSGKKARKKAEFFLLLLLTLSACSSSPSRSLRGI